MKLEYANCQQLMARSVTERNLFLLETQFTESGIQYANALRKYSENQVEHWRKLPYLMLLTDDRVGLGLEYPPYIFGYHPIEATRDRETRICKVWVDCETGQLIQPAPYDPKNTGNPRRIPFESKPALNSDVLRIGPFYQELHAKGLVSVYLHDIARLDKLRRDPGSDPEMAFHWGLTLLDPTRQEMIDEITRETGLRPIFTRNPEPLPFKLDASPTGITQI
jgi:hypothetical protein